MTIKEFKAIFYEELSLSDQKALLEELGLTVIEETNDVVDPNYDDFIPAS